MGPRARGPALLAATVALAGWGFPVPAALAGWASPAPAALAGWASPAPAAAQEADEVLERGEEVYNRWCASCHGMEGDGEGPAAEYMLPRPRDFTRGIYQIRTTAGGALPTDDDLMRVIDEGMPGTTMPGWEDELSRRDRQAVLEYMKSFYTPWDAAPEPEPMDFGSEPRATDEALERGRVFYDSIECYQCHGDAGRGEGTSAPELEDDRGYPLRAADLHKNWRFDGGGSAEEIYRRLLTGMDGTPMPSHADLVDAGVVTDEELWNLAQYVRSLSPDRPPRTGDVVAVERREPGEVPSTVDDERWEEVEAFYFPLVPQIVVEPRWFDAAVKGVWVQGLHDEEELALRVTWHDRSESPDPAWMEWQERVIDVMEPVEGEPHEPELRPDRFAVQFPQEVPEENERPYFLMGDDASPVYLWRWRSDQEGAEEAEARGIHDVQPLGTDALAADAAWEGGRWRVLFRRSLEPDDAQQQVPFPVGEPLPVAFFAWDGDHGEEGARGAVSTWYSLQLVEEVPLRAYVIPVVVMLLTAGLGLGVVRRAQQRYAAAQGEGSEAPEEAAGARPAAGPVLQSRTPTRKEEEP